MFYFVISLGIKRGLLDDIDNKNTLVETGIYILY